MSATTRSAAPGAAAIRGPRATTVPGLSFRMYTGSEDLPAMMVVGRAAREAAGLAEFATLDGMVNTYSHLTNCDPRRDVLIAQIDGTAVAYGRTWWADRNGGDRAFEAICLVHPGVRGKGIGGALLAWQDAHRIEQARAMAASGELEGRPVVLTAYLQGPTAGGRRLMVRYGYAIARRHAEMHRPGLEDIPDLPLPDGIELRSVEPGDREAMRRAFDVDAEVFRDHWGDVDASETAWESWLTDPDIQPGLWVVAVDAATGENAGQILGYVAPGPDGRLVGWTESIAVRRPWRRRGLASAMLAASLRKVRDAGAVTAALGVDLQNENRASAIYERLGFRVSVEELEYHRRIGHGDLESDGTRADRLRPDGLQPAGSGPEAAR